MKKKAVVNKVDQKRVTLQALSVDIKSVDERISNLEARFDHLEKKVGRDILASEKRMKDYTQEALDLAFRGFYAVHEKTQDNIKLLIEKMDSINVLIYKTDKHDTVLENHSHRLTAVETVLAER